MTVSKFRRLPLKMFSLYFNLKVLFFHIKVSSIAPADMPSSTLIHCPASIIAENINTRDLADGGRWMVVN